MEKRVLLVNRDGRQRWLEQKANGTFWEGEEEIFTSETEALQKGWKVDAVKVVFSEIVAEEKK